MRKKYIMLNSEQAENTEVLPESSLKKMVYFGENSKNYCFPDIKVNKENQTKLQNLVEEYKGLIEQDRNNDLDMITFFQGKQINPEHVDEFEEPRDVFILLIYFKEICNLAEFEPVSVVEKQIFDKHNFKNVGLT